MIAEAIGEAINSNVLKLEPVKEIDVLIFLFF